MPDNNNISSVSSNNPVSFQDKSEESQDLEAFSPAVLKFIEKLYENSKNQIDPKKAAETLGESLKKNPPSNWKDFSSLIEKQLGVSSQSAYDSLLGEFDKKLGLGLKEGKVEGGDWALLENAKYAPNFDEDSSRNPFIAAFNTFASHFSGKIKPGSSPEDVLNQFFSRYDSFMLGGNTLVVSLMKETELPNKIEGVGSFESIYQAFTKNPSKEDFEKKLGDFYDKQVQDSGYFLPTHAFTDWVQERKDDFSVKMSSSGVEKTSMEKVSSSSVASNSPVMKAIYALLATTDTLQRLATVQAAELQTYAQIEGVYTTLEGQVPFFKENGPENLWGGSGTDQTNTRNMENSTFTQPTIANLQANRGLYEDASKTIQNDLSSTVKEVESQMDIVQKLLDMLNTIFSQMFR